jgi:hypothetical protein
MEAQTEARPVLVGRHLRIRPGHPGDAPRLQAILAEPNLSRRTQDGHDLVMRDPLVPAA